MTKMAAELVRAITNVDNLISAHETMQSIRAEEMAKPTTLDTALGRIDISGVQQRVIESFDSSAASLTEAASAMSDNQKAVRVLERYKDIPEVQERLDKVYNYYKSLKPKES